MQVQILTVMNVSAPDINIVADAIYKTLNNLADNANFNLIQAQEKVVPNAVLRFEVTEIRPGSTVLRVDDYTFPNDLEQELNKVS